MKEGTYYDYNNIRMKGQVVVLGIPYESKEIIYVYTIIYTYYIVRKRGYEILLSNLFTSNVVRVRLGFYILTSMYFFSIFIFFFFL